QGKQIKEDPGQRAEQDRIRCRIQFCVQSFKCMLRSCGMVQQMRKFDHCSARCEPVEHRSILRKTMDNDQWVLIGYRMGDPCMHLLCAINMNVRENENVDTTQFRNGSF